VAAIMEMLQKTTTMRQLPALLHTPATEHQAVTAGAMGADPREGVWTEGLPQAHDAQHSASRSSFAAPPRDCWDHHVRINSMGACIWLFLSADTASARRHSRPHWVEPTCQCLLCLKLRLACRRAVTDGPGERLTILVSRY